LENQTKQNFWIKHDKVLFSCLLLDVKKSLSKNKERKKQEKRGPIQLALHMKGHRR